MSSESFASVSYTCRSDFCRSGLTVAFPSLCKRLEPQLRRIPRSNQATFGISPSIRRQTRDTLPPKATRPPVSPPAPTSGTGAPLQGRIKTRPVLPLQAGSTVCAVAGYKGDPEDSHRSTTCSVASHQRQTRDQEDARPRNFSRGYLDEDLTSTAICTPCLVSTTQLSGVEPLILPGPTIQVSTCHGSAEICNADHRPRPGRVPSRHHQGKSLLLNRRTLAPIAY